MIHKMSAEGDEAGSGGSPELGG